MSYSAIFRKNSNQSVRNFVSENDFLAWFGKEKDVLWAVLVKVEDGDIVTSVFRKERQVVVCA